jgi:hypothetical protein
MSNPIFLTRSPLTLPSIDSPDFLRRLKTLIDYREGQTNDQGGRFVTLEQLRAMGLISSISSPIASVVGGGTADSGDTDAPNPPTNLVITNKIITHHLSWASPTDDDLSHIEVWRATSQDRFNATLVAIATAPVEEVDIPGIDQTTNYYYWIRAIDTAGNHSVWNPSNQQGGELVEANVNGEIASIVSKLTGQITDSHLYSALQTKIDGSASAVVTHSGVLDDLTAEHYIKTDVGGHIAGFGLHNTGATSDFIINADKFAIITPGSPSGTISKVPFIVGVVDGVSTVGINGQLVVDNTIRGESIIANSITSDKIGAGEIKAINIEADAITGDKIAATSSIILNEGGKLTVGNNNIILDSVTNKLIIAPDNGDVIGTANLTGHDYCDLSQGDVNFMYWRAGVGHVLYNSLKRIEAGFVSSGVSHTIPGYWRTVPSIMVSPKEIPTYSHHYPTQSQRISCSPANIAFNDGICTFMPVAKLNLTAQTVATSGTANVHSWAYSGASTTITTTQVSTPNNTVSVSVSASFSQTRDDKNYTAYCYIRVNNVDYLVYQTPTGTRQFWTTKSLTVVVANVPATISAKMIFSPSASGVSCEINAQLHAGTYELAGTELNLVGTLNYLAIGA